MKERATLLGSGPGERALARWPALAAEASKVAAAESSSAGGGGAGKDGNDLVAAVGGGIERWLLERATWLDNAFAQSPPGARAYPASFAAVA